MMTNSTEMSAAVDNTDMFVPRQVLAAEQLAQLNQRSNRLGLIRFAGHLLILCVSGGLWALAPLWLALPAL